MTASISAQDLEFLRRFEACELPEREWAHLAHLRIAWTCLAIASPEPALQRIRDGILRYNTEVLNRRHKYHETVTVAFTHIVAERTRDNEGWKVFSSRVDDVLSADEPILLRYYSKSVLFSDLARNQFVEPDLLHLPPLKIEIGAQRG